MNDKKTWDTEPPHIICEVLNNLTEPRIKDFDCGNEEINNHIQRYSSFSQSERFFILVDESTNKAICVYSLKATAIVRQGSKYSGAYYDPAIEIAVFAVDVEYQDIKCNFGDTNGYLSDYFLCYVLNRIAHINRNVCAVEYIMLFSTAEAVHFYKRNHFQEFTSYMKNIKNIYSYIRYCTPMYLPVPNV